MSLVEIHGQAAMGSRGFYYLLAPNLELGSSTDWQREMAAPTWQPEGEAHSLEPGPQLPTTTTALTSATAPAAHAYGGH